MNRIAFLKIALAAASAIALSSVVAVPASVPASVQQHGTYSHGTTIPATAGTVERGGVVRFGTAGPSLYTNGAHESVGIIPSSVRINAQGNLELMLDTILPVVNVNVTPDETLVLRNIEGGLSGGRDKCVITFTHPKVGKLNLRWPSHYALISGETSNVWIGVTSFSSGE